MRDTFAPLRMPGFRHLTVAYTVNELGNWLGEIALAVLVFEATGSPLATAALFLGMQFVPAVASQGLAAKLEASGVAKALPLLYLAEGATFLLIALAAENFALGLIVALAAVDGMIAIVSRTFTRASTVAILEPAGLLRQGNAVLNICFTVVGAAGPAMAGVLVATSGAQTALLADAASFLLVAALLAANRKKLPDLRADSDPWRERLVQGLGYVRNRAGLRRLLWANAAALTFLTAVIPIEIVYATDSLSAGSSGYGALLASWGAGMVVGSIIFAFARRASLKILLLLSALAVGGSAIGLSVAQTLLVACLVNAVGGVGNGVMWVSTVCAVQEMTAERFQARVLGLLEATSSAVPGIGFLIGGLVTQVASPRTTYLIAGIGALLVVAIAAPILARARWGRERQASVSAADQLSALDPAEAPLIP